MMFLSTVSLLVLFGSIQLVTPKQNSIKKVALANNMFALKLHKTYNEHTSENIFLSPVSVFTALGMLYTGARSSTRMEIRQVLSYDESGLDRKNVGKHIKRFLNSLFLTSNTTTLKIANALLSQHDCPISQNYQNFLKNNYNAVVREVDFRNDSEKAIDEINEWVRNKTEGKITKLIESLDSDMALILLNAVYFQGKWEMPFDVEATAEGKFYNNGTEEVLVPTMINEGEYRYGNYSEYGLQAIQLRYAGNQFSMILLLPHKRNGVLGIEENLTLTVLDDILEGLDDENVIIRLPKFKMEDSRELKQNLEELGMKKSFTDMADFRKINEVIPLKVSDVVHRGVVEVNEFGTEAAGATMIGIVGRSFVRATYLDIDHPFLFLIRHEMSGAILFIGRVNQLQP